MHIDVNNAFLSWTAIDLLNKGYGIDIRTIEAVIGGDENQRKGIVLAKSPIAKKKGVKTAETLRDARRKCSNLKIYPPNQKWYNKMSTAVFEIVSSYTPDIEIVSVDECFIDYTGVYKMYGEPIQFAYKLKDEIYTKLGFTVNIGVANNKLCAKMASDFEKPNKVHALFDNEIVEKMYPLEIRDLYGIGKKSAEKLRELKILTIGDLACTKHEYLYKYFKNQAGCLIDRAKGLDKSQVITESEERKGISNSTTLPYNLTKNDEILFNLQKLVESVCIKLRRENKYGHVVGVKIRDKHFYTYSHQRKLVNATNNTEEVFKVAKELLLEMWNEEPIRLLGVSITNLDDKPKRQMSLFEVEDDIIKNDVLEKTVDNLKYTYGTNIIKRASLVDREMTKKNK